MTRQEEEIIQAIWGNDADVNTEELAGMVQGIFAMSDLIHERLANGKCLAPLSDTVH